MGEDFYVNAIKKTEEAIIALLDKQIDAIENADLQKVEQDTGQSRVEAWFRSPKDVSIALFNLERRRNEYLKALYGCGKTLVPSRNVEYNGQKIYFYI